MALIEAQNLSKQFGKSAPAALNNINVSFERGESVAIVGESGSGKTTLARILLGLESPTGGDVNFMGNPVATQGPEWRDARRHLQLIPQHASGALDPRMSIRGHFLEVIKAHQLADRVNREELMIRRLEEVRLDSKYLSMFPRRMSGGQQQRAVIARGLLVEPEVLICDEPTSALDPLTQQQIIALLAARCIDENRLFGIITHDLRVARKLCRRIIVMRRGEIVEDGPADEVFNRPQHPYTKDLLDAVKTHRRSTKSTASSTSSDHAPRILGQPVGVITVGNINAVS